MEPVETWDNIWKGNGKDNGRLWTTSIPSRSPLSCVWVAAALPNHVWNFWLQRQHTHVFFHAFSASSAGKLVAAHSQGRPWLVQCTVFFIQIIKLPCSGCFQDYTEPARGHMVGKKHFWCRNLCVQMNNLQDHSVWMRILENVNL